MNLNCCFIFSDDDWMIYLGSLDLSASGIFHLTSYNEIDKQ